VTTWLDGGYWAHYFRRVFARQIAALHRAVEERLLPTFDGIGAEAEQITSDEFDRLKRTPGDDCGDMADLAETAQEAGFAHYEELTSVRQAILNLAAAALYHCGFRRCRSLSSAEGDHAFRSKPITDFG
jgi:hypothetical protein